MAFLIAMPGGVKPKTVCTLLSRIIDSDIMPHDVATAAPIAPKSGINIKLVDKFMSNPAIAAHKMVLFRSRLTHINKIGPQSADTACPETKIKRGIVAKV